MSAVSVKSVEAPVTSAPIANPENVFAPAVIVLLVRVAAKASNTKVSLPVSKGRIIFLSAMIAFVSKIYWNVLAGFEICNLRSRNEVSNAPNTLD